MTDIRYPIHVFDYDSVDVSTNDFIPPRDRSIAGIHANSSGTVTLRSPDSDADVSFQVVAGMAYPYPFTAILAAGTSANVNVIYSNRG